MDNVSNAGGAAAIIVSLFWLVLAVGMLVWYLWAMARLFPRIGMKSTDGWIPVWNQWKLLERVGLPGWVVLLAFVGLGIVPGIMMIIAMHRLGREYGAGAGYTVLGVFIPPLWATLFANFVGESGAQIPGRAAPGVAPAAPPVTSPFAVNPQHSFGQPQAPAGYAAPQAPQFAAPAAPAAPAVPPAAPAARQPWAAAEAAASAAATARSSAAVPSFAAQLGGETEAEYDRLAAEGFQAPPATPLGQHQAPAAFSWTAARAAQEPAEPLVLPEAAVPPVHPLAAPPAAAPPAVAAPPAPPTTPVSVAAATEATQKSFVPAPSDPDPRYASPASAQPTPAPSVHKATGITGMVEPLTEDSYAGPMRTPGRAETDSAEDEMDLDKTVVAPRRNRANWVLVLPDGTEYPVEDDVVIGRKPELTGGAAILAVPDSTRTLSKSHVRLTRDGERWLVEDLGSTNGLVLLNEDGTESELAPGVRVEATERMLFGTLEVRLRMSGDSA